MLWRFYINNIPIFQKQIYLEISRYSSLANSNFSETMITSEASLAGSENLSACHLLIIEFQDFKRTIYLEKPTYSIGRSIDNSVVVASQEVSRYHATLIRRTNIKNNSFSYWILDGDLQGNRSTNGILINNKKSLVRELKHKDTIHFSNSVQARYYTITDSEALSRIIPQVYSSSDGKVGEFKQPLQATVVISKQKDETISSDSTLSSSSTTKIKSNLDEGQLEGNTQYQDFYDYVTDLPNRTLFNEQLSTALALAKRNQQPLAVLYVDLNRFRTINATFGYNTGDLVLKSFAERVKFCLRSEDVFARWGGDKFAILLPQVDQGESAAKVSRRILAALESPFQVDAQLHLQVSIGIAVYPQDGEDTETLLKRADVALARNKEQNSDYQFYSPSTTSKASQLLAIESLLHQAVEKREFDLYYQPQVNINTKRISSIEALLRCHNPELGQISTAELISRADKSGLAIPLTRWVLQTACVQNKAWQQAGLPPLRVTVNISGKQFQQPDLVDTVVQVLHQTGLEPCWLELEIPETALLEKEDASQKVFQLQVMGVSISIDDFGADCCSLNHLKDIPIRTLKTDRSLIRNLNKKQQNRKLLTAIATLGNIFEVGVVAKGIETSQQLNLLRRLGCEEMQGYLFSQPLEGEKLTRLLSSFTSQKF